MPTTISEYEHLLSSEEKDRWRDNSSEARQIISKSFAGNFLLFPSAQGKNYLTAVVKEPQGTVINIRFEFRDGNIYDNNGTLINSISEVIRLHNQQKKVEMLTEQEQKKFVKPEEVQAKMKTLQVGDYIISTPPFMGSSLELMVKTETGVAVFKYLYQDGKKLFSAEEVEVDVDISTYTKKIMDQEAALLDAIKNNDANFIKQLPKNSPINLNMLSNNKIPMYVAAKLGNAEVIKALIDKGASFKHKQALALFKKNGHVDVEVEALLRSDFPPRGQEWFIDLMKGMGYPAKAEGFCFAIQKVGRAAILTEDSNPSGLANFNARFRELATMKPDTIVTKIAEVNNNFVTQIQDTKRKRLTEWGITDEKTLSKEQKNSLQKEIDNLRASLSQQDQVILDVPAFFDSIEIFQELFKQHETEIVKGQVVYTLEKAHELASQLVTPAFFEEMGGEVMVDSISGAYTPTDLEKYFSSFKEMMLKAKSADPAFNHPVSFELSSSNHAISVSYNPKKDAWIFLDANDLPAQFIRDDKEIANKVSGAFATLQHTIIFANIFIAKNPDHLQDADKIKAHELNFKQHLDKWKSSSQYKEVHKVTAEKARAVDEHQSSWLHLAAEIGDTKKTKELLKAGANRELKTVDSYPSFNNKTPFDMAIRGSQVETATLLRKGNAFTRNWKESLVLGTVAGIVIAGGIVATLFVPPIGLALIGAGILASAGFVALVKKMDVADPRIEGLKKNLAKESDASFKVPSEQISSEIKLEQLQSNKQAKKTTAAFVLGKVGIKKPVNDANFNMETKQASRKESEKPAVRTSAELSNQEKTSDKLPPPKRKF